MDDLFALLEEDDDQLLLPGRDDASHTSEPRRAVDRSQPASAPKSIQERLSSSIDAQIGLRILNRKISGSEMMDMIAASVYRSPAVLSAMSLEDLNNNILIEPTMVVDASTVCGRTNFCTVGIVFSNSGTRTSSTGNAFCVLTLGNFASGPAISVLLFGTAYSKYIRTLTPGKVVFLENVRLLPNKKNNDRSSTTISFSANNDQEIQLVGDAQDFGTCKGTIRGKNENGQWTENAKRCRSYVDTRECLYCKVHRQQSNGVDKSGNKMEKLRQESRDCPPQTNFPVNRAGMQNVNNITHLQKPTNPAQVMMRAAAQPSVGSSVRVFHLNDASQKQQGKNPMLQDYSVKTVAQTKTTKVIASRNPYQQGPPPKVASLSRKTPCRSLMIKNPPPVPTKSSHPDLLGQMTGVRPNANKRKLASVNTDTGHFDGQVLVPKAKQFAPMHREKAAMFQARQPKPSLDVGTKSESDILQRQRDLALQRRNQGAGKSQPLRPTPQNLLVAKKNGAAATPASKASDIFGSIGKEEMARVMAAKSRFANEADAEEYARARQAVLELEKEECKTLSQDKKKQVPTKTNPSSIKTEYFCVQCNRNFVKVPALCHQMHHKIHVDRKILGTQTTAEKRMILSTKSVEDGGMMLAQGIDWSNRFSSRA